MKKGIIALALAVLALALLVPAVATGATVTPVLVEDWKSGNASFECKEAAEILNVSCADYAYKVEGAAPNGTYAYAGNAITISNSDGKKFDWSSIYPVQCVIVKAGTGAYLYYYGSGGAYCDSGLDAPYGKEISHVTFCFNGANPPAPYERLAVGKTAETSYTRTHFWDIDKTVETENGYQEGGLPKVWLWADGRGDETATWTVDVSYEGYEDSDFNVCGEITIENTGKLDAVITAIDDLLAGDEIEVELPEGVTLPYTLAVGDTLTCSYSEDVSGKIEGRNEVTVTTERDTYTAEAELVWGDPSTEVNKTVNVVDESDLFGTQELGTATAPNGAQFTYTKDFAWDDYGKGGAGDYTYSNTATIVETEQSAAATLKVNVQGYIYEPAYAKGESAWPFIPTFSNWGWTNPILKGTYEWDLWAGAGQCDTNKGTKVGSVTVVYAENGCVTVQYNVTWPITIEETHVYAGYDKFPKVMIGKRKVETVAPGQYYNASPFDGRQVYVIAHAVVGIPDPSFGPAPAGTP